jgi:glycosyltransferase involved in cell wall biosynthesis
VRKRCTYPARRRRHFQTLGSPLPAQRIRWNVEYEAAAGACRQREGLGPLISLIIPAYNEANVIARCLGALLREGAGDELEVLVVCNGCSDNTAEVARAFGEPVRVIETELPSKTNALNLGETAARGFPRFYLDADVVITLEAVRKIAAVLTNGPALAAAPRPVNIFLPGTQWAVRAYYRFWTALPYIQEGMIAAGCYALSSQGRARFKDFPDVIADDGYVRLLFTAGERVQVLDAVSEVCAPLALRDLLKIKTRSRLGVLQLRGRYPDLAHRETIAKNYRHALMAMLRRPSLYLSAVPYVYVAIASWLRAQQQMKVSGRYVWERDDSSRRVLSADG